MSHPEDVSIFIDQQQAKFLAHIIRKPNDNIVKSRTFEDGKRHEIARLRAALIKCYETKRHQHQVILTTLR